MKLKSMFKTVIPTFAAISLSACLSVDDNGGSGGGSPVSFDPPASTAPALPAGINKTMNASWALTGRGYLVQRAERGSSATGETRVCFKNLGPRRAEIVPKRPGFNALGASAGGHPCVRFPASARVGFEIAVYDGPVRSVVSFDGNSILNYNMSPLNGGTLFLTLDQSR